MRHIVVAVIAVLSLAPSPARAGEWSGTQTLTRSPGEQIDTFTGAVASNARGDVVVAWVRGYPYDRSLCCEASRVMASVRPQGGRFGRVQALSTLGLHVEEISAGIDAEGRATVLWKRSSEDTPDLDMPGGIGAASSDVDGRFGHAVTLERPASVDNDMPRLAVAPSGEALAIWQEDRAGPNSGLPDPDRLMGSVKPVGGVFARARAISPVDEAISHNNFGDLIPAFWPSVGVDGAGDFLVAWSRGHRGADEIEASVRSPGGRFGPVRTLTSDVSENDFRPRVSVGSTGASAVDWYTSTGHRAVFGPAPAALGAPERTPSFALQSGFAFRRSGEALLLAAGSATDSTQPLGGPEVAFERAPGGGYSDPLTLAPNGVGGSVVVAPDDAAYAAWETATGEHCDRECYPSGFRVHVAEAAPGGKLAVLPFVSPSGDDTDPPAVAALEPGAALVVWGSEAGAIHYAARGVALGSATGSPGPAPKLSVVRPVVHGRRVTICFRLSERARVVARVVAGQGVAGDFEGLVSVRGGRGANTLAIPGRLLRDKRSGNDYSVALFAEDANGNVVARQSHARFRIRR